MPQGPILSWQKEDGLSGTQQVFYASDFHNSVLIKNIAQCLMLIRSPEWGEAGARLLCEQIVVTPGVFARRKTVI